MLANVGLMVFGSYSSLIAELCRRKPGKLVHVDSNLLYIVLIQILPVHASLAPRLQIVDFPVVYCSDEFSRMMGYPRCDIMQSPAAGDFMAGALTDAVTVGKEGRIREGRGLVGDSETRLH